MANHNTAALQPTGPTHPTDKRERSSRNSDSAEPGLSRRETTPRRFDLLWMGLLGSL